LIITCLQKPDRPAVERCTKRYWFCSKSYNSSIQFLLKRGLSQPKGRNSNCRPTIQISYMTNANVNPYFFSLINAWKCSRLIATYWPIIWTNKLTYLLTPCSTILLENQTGLQLVKKFPTF
jgi:hypothetical protein